MMLTANMDDPADALQPSQERRLVTAIPGPRSRDLLARRAAAVARGVTTMIPVFVSQAAGGVLVDVDGNSLIDFGSGIAVTSVGNSAPRVVERLCEQAARFTHTCFMVTPYEGYVEVCEALNRLTPGDHEKRSVLFNSGAEAIENAVKIARAYTKRKVIVVFDFAYHGRTHLTMAMTYRYGIDGLAEIVRVPMAYSYRWPTGPERCGDEALASVLDRIKKQTGPENVAALLLEPIQGEGGVITPPPGFLPQIAAFCRENGIVFIADEIQTGFCRTGDWFACEHERIVPDLIATAKGIAGGMPLAGVTGRAEIMNALHVGGLGGTFCGNPVACAAALGAIATMEAEDLAGRARRLGDVMLARVRALADKYDMIGDIRGRGAMIGLEIVRGRKDVTPNPRAATAIAKACHAEGLIVLTCGAYDNVLRLLPPLVMPDHLLDEGLTILERSFASL